MTAAAIETMPFEVTDLTPVIGTEVKMAARDASQRALRCAGSRASGAPQRTGVPADELGR